MDYESPYFILKSVNDDTELPMLVFFNIIKSTKREMTLFYGKGIIQIQLENFEKIIKYTTQMKHG